MRYNQIGVLALTGLILAVVASGTAFAQTSYPYGGLSESSYTSGNPSWVQTSSGGNGPVSVGDVVSWSNQLDNNAGRQVTGYVDSSTFPSGGLNYREDYCTINPSKTWPDWYATTIATAGGHTILASHTYRDQNNYYTITQYDMSYT